MFNIVNHFVYEFRGTPAMASDIATVGTALEVADGYKNNLISVQQLHW